MGIRFSAFAPCKYFFALAAVTEKVFSTITLTNYEYFAVAILVDKWVASLCNLLNVYQSTSCNPRRQVGCQIVLLAGKYILCQVAILVDKWVASEPKVTGSWSLNVAILVDKWVARGVT